MKGRGDSTRKCIVITGKRRQGGSLRLEELVEPNIQEKRLGGNNYSEESRSNAWAKDLCGYCKE